MEDKKVIQIKSELSGNFQIRRLNPNQIKKLKHNFGDTKYYRKYLLEDIILNSKKMESTEGVYTTLSASEDGLVENGDFNHIYKPVPDNINSEEGIYIFIAKENKSGFSIELDVTQDNFCLNKLEILYKEMDYFFLYNHETNIHNIIVGLKYDGKDYTNQMNLYGGPYSVEFTIFQAIDKNLRFIFRWVEDHSTEWFDEITQQNAT